MKKILFLIIIFGLLLGVNACKEESALYEIGSQVEASFPSTMVNYQMIAEDGNKIKVEMWRGNTSGTASVPVTITDKTGGIFVPEKEQFDFPEGESKAFLIFNYPDLDQFGGEKYEIVLTITDEDQVSPAGKKTISVSAQRKLTYISIGTGTFTSEFFEESWPQEVLKAEEADFYRLPNCYYTGFPIEFSIDNGQIVFAKQQMGYNHSTYGMTSWDPRYLSECEIVGKTFTFVVNFVVDAGSFGGYYEVLEMP